MSIPVRNQAISYYEVDPATFDHYLTAPLEALPFAARARARELDHLLLAAPGPGRAP